MTTPVGAEARIEAEIVKAAAAGTIVDKRADMPMAGHWPNRPAASILGVCIHQNAGGSDPRTTARYHTSPNNHITPGRPLPSICYHLAVVDNEDPPWLVANPLWRTYAQGSSAPGDENTHLLAILVMGDFDGPGHKGRTGMPSLRQMRNIEAAVKWVQLVFKFDDAGVFGHYHFGKAACPGYAVQEYIESRRKTIPDLSTTVDWQRALLRWNRACLPKFGADGIWGDEGKYAIAAFQRAMGMQVTGLRDPFTELMLLKRYTS